MAIYTHATGPTVREPLTLKELPVYGSSRLGIYYKIGSRGKYAYQLTDHLGNVRAVVMKTGSNALSLTNKTDYYPFGMAMPDRNVEGGYRYGYQGEYAEKDPEIGMEAFELRLWDSRIGRWLSPDPYGQYASPYLGMGNNPANGIDPDCGWWQEFKNWVVGKGWNSNNALDFQANGGELGKWIGDRFTGYREGFKPASSYGEEMVIARFNAVQDYKVTIAGREFEYFLDLSGAFSIGLQVSGNINDMVGRGVNLYCHDLFSFNNNRKQQLFYPWDDRSVWQDVNHSLSYKSVLGLEVYGVSESNGASRDNLAFRNILKEIGVTGSGSLGILSGQVKYHKDRLHNVSYLEARIGVEGELKLLVGIEGDLRLVIRHKL
jgi:RHS repeat-associated protein